MVEKKRRATAEESFKLATECGRLADLVVEVSGSHLVGPLANCIAILLEEFTAGHRIPAPKGAAPKAEKDKAMEYGMSKKELAELEKLLDPTTPPRVPTNKALADLQKVLDEIKKKKR